MPWHLLPDILCVGFCLVGAFSDIRTRRIPNAVTFPALLIAIVTQSALQLVATRSPQAFLGSMVAIMLGLFFLASLFLGLHYIGMMGMGDVKLAAAIGAFMAWPRVIDTALLIFLCGGIWALIVALREHKLKNVLNNIRSHSRFRLRDNAQPSQVHPMVYGPAIASGVIVAVILNFFHLSLLFL